MYHDESIGEIKVTISVVKIVLLHHGVSINGIIAHARKQEDVKFAKQKWGGKVLIMCSVQSCLCAPVSSSSVAETE